MRLPSAKTLFAGVVVLLPVAEEVCWPGVRYEGSPVLVVEPRSRPVLPATPKPRPSNVPV